MGEREYVMKKILNFIHDESGQSTTEYILMLAVVVMIAMKFKQQFQGRINNLISTVGNQLDSAASSQ